VKTKDTNEAEQDFHKILHAIQTLNNYQIISDYLMEELDQKMTKAFYKEAEIANKEEGNEGNSMALECGTFFQYVEHKNAFLDMYISALKKAFSH
jgi:hypothetical protein